MPKTKEAALMDAVETVDESSTVVDENATKRVVPGDPEWSDFLLQQLVEGEYVENKGKKLPLTDALPRLVTKFLGKITESRSELADRSYENDGNYPTVTVEHTIRISSYGLYEEVGTESIFVGIADANIKNVDPIYNKYLAANASTRAKGRALRDALMLRVCVAEELSKVAEQDDSSEYDRLSTTQKAAIENLCKRLKVDVNKFIKMGEIKFATLDEVTNGKAKAMMSLLNKYQQGTDPPDNILL